jgi:hypothetical protein
VSLFRRFWLCFNRLKLSFSRIVVLEIHEARSPFLAM